MADDERPTSMGQALESAGFGSDDTASVADAGSDSSVVDGSSPSDISTSSDATTAGSNPESVAAATESPSGPIPFADHDRIVKGFHTKLDAATSQLQALAWAQQVPAEVGPRLVEMARRVQGDPVGFLVELASEVQNDPKHAVALKSYAAKVLGTRSNGNGSTPPQSPQSVALQMPEGARTGIPEVDSVLEARDRWLAEQLGSQLSTIMQERVGPLASLAERVAQAETDQQEHARAESWAQAEFATVSKLPGFSDHQAAIGDRFVAEMQKYPKSEQTEARAALVLRDVYHAIVLPTLTKSSSDTVLKTLTAKAVRGSLGASPTTAASASRPKSMADALAQAGL